MWVFTEWAAAFDKVKSDNEKALDGWLQDWVATTLDDSSPWYRNAAIYTTAGAAYAINKLSTEVLASFVDVLRLGDGVQEGGWGYGKDALRLLMVAGPAVRGARYGISLVAAVDETAQVGNCTWIAAARALRLTGTRHFARLGDLAIAAGTPIEETGGIFADKLIKPLSVLGAEAKSLGTLNSMEAVANAARTNPNGVVMFSLKWGKGGHTLLATRGPGGIVRIIDRSGKVVSSVAELESLYPGISSATNYGAAVLVNGSRIVTLLDNAPLLLNLVAVELRSVPIPPGGVNAPIVLRTDSQLLTGWWIVQVSQWTWIYHFDAQGNVSWTDPYNLKTAPKGAWRATTSGININWPPPSKTTEVWSVPVTTSSETGKYFSDGKTLPLKAYKLDMRPLIGKWKVQVDKWTWTYDFDGAGGVRWTDPFNGRTGKGAWKVAHGRILIKWAPPSTTTEEWVQPLNPQSQTGKCTMNGKTIPLSARKL